MKKIHPELGLCCSFCGEPNPELVIRIFDKTTGIRGQEDQAIEVQMDEIDLHKVCWLTIKNTIKQLHRAVL